MMGMIPEMTSLWMCTASTIKWHHLFYLPSLGPVHDRVLTAHCASLVWGKDRGAGSRVKPVAVLKFYCVQRYRRRAGLGTYNGDTIDSMYTVSLGTQINLFSILSANTNQNFATLCQSVDAIDLSNFKTEI